MSVVVLQIDVKSSVSGIIEIMMQVKNFSESLEKDLQRLHVEMGASRKEGAPASQMEHTLVKQSLERMAESIPMPHPSQAPARAPAITVQATGTSPLPGYLAKGDQPEQIKQEVNRLVGLVFSDSISTAIAESKRHSPFVQDAFHDALVDKLLPELKKRGMI